MKLVNRVLFILHALTGVGAMGGGMMAILYPQGPAGMPADALKNSPFSDFLIPGIILFTVIGLGNVFSAIMIIVKSKYQGYISCVFGGALMIWLIVQCIILNAVVALHVIFFVIGFVQAMLGLILLFKDNLFPTNIILNVYKGIRKKS
ncbi:MAG TPA: hypothetical protein VJ888_00530 [Mobilitalea sp.]|nr:hypothetical protein [Mobilitalea sp.]